MKVLESTQCLHGHKIVISKDWAGGTHWRDENGQPINPIFDHLTTNQTAKPCVKCFLAYLESIGLRT